MARAIVLMMDSLGIGASADADEFGDQGADTLGHIAEHCAQGRVQIDGSDPSLLGDPMMLWMLVQADFEWRLPEAAVENVIDAYLIRQVRAEMVGVPESELAEMASFLRMDLIESAIDQGWLRQGSDGYEIDFLLEAGFPEINGQLVDPTQLLGGLGPSS